MTKDGHPNRRAISAGLIAAGAFAVSRTAQSAEPSAADKAKAFAALPDWTGVWMGIGTTLFEQKAGAASLNANNPNARDFPPYKPAWEAAYTAFLNNVVKQEKFSDPLSLGYPGGMIRMMSPARGLQFVLRPEQVWIIYERPDVRYIYTDGRPFPPKDELWPTFEGYSIGHWEGDTLVVETVSLRGGVPIDRTGAALSDEAHVVERIRKTDNNTLQSDITIEDPVAFTAPWKVTRRYTNRREKYPRMENVSSLENQRNPVVNGETKIILAGDSDPSSPYPPDIRPFALAKFPFPR
jgi:hypothetical protein